ncbi:hypothetical protein Tsubulata_018310, partial [Turnera subulata]
QQMASPSGGQRNHSDEEKDEAYGYAQQLVWGIVLHMAMQGAIELGVFEIIAQEGPDAKLSASQIAAEMQTKNPEAPTMLDRILRLLATYNVLGCSMDGMDRYFVSDQDGVSLGPFMALIQDKVYLESWCRLKAATLEGGTPFDRVHGMHAFEYPGLDPRFNQGFEHLKVLVDVGGGLGHTLKAITSRHPHVKGINFDLPQVIEHAPELSWYAFMFKRLDFDLFTGDMFESVPKADAVFIKSILHDWSDDHCLKLLKNCYQAIPDDGKVVIVEAVCPVGEEITSNAAKITFLGDVQMMTQTPGGKERTEHEFRALATGAGFRGIRIECFVSNLSVMEFFKYAQHLMMGTVLHMAMQGAIELGVFEIIAQEGPDAKLSASQIAAKMQTKNPEAPRMLDRILRLLASYNVLGCSMDGMDKLYSLAPVSRYFVPNQDGVSLRPVMALIQDKVFMESWYQLKDAVLEGGTPFDRVHGVHAFEYPRLDPRFNQVFNTAMLNGTTLFIKDILETYKGFEHLKVLVDVGGGLGHTLKAITSKHPHIKGINFDLPQVWNMLLEICLKPFQKRMPCQLKDAVLEGGTPFVRVHGVHAFEYPRLDPRFNQDILEAYKGFERLEVLVDVGGGLGHTLKAITSKHPHVKGINFDLPQVIEHAPAYPGVEHVAGDMFESVPKADAVLLKWILHDWSDDHCLKLLKSCYQAIPDDGKVVIVEAVCPVGEEITSTAAKTTFLRDVLMMTQNPGSKERTEHEFRALATGAGFRGIRFVCFVSNLWVMEFFK